MAEKRFFNHQPFVSVIIPTFNSEITLAPCLSAISSLKYPKNKLEIILIDNGSTDHTLEIARKYNIKVFIKPNINISALRNFGAKIALGDVLAFTDSDCIVSKEWLRNAMVHLEEDKIGAAGCGYDIPENARWIEKAWFFFRKSEAHSVRRLPGGNLTVKRFVFKKIGGFNEDLITGEDSEFCNRLKEAGFTIISDKQINVVHLGNPKTLYAFLKKEIWHGKGMLGAHDTDKWNKPFVVSNMYLASFIGLILGFPFAIYYNMFYLLLIPISFLLLLPIIASLHRSLLSRNLRKFPVLIPIYFAYCMGRMVSLLWIYQQIYKKNFVTRKINA